LKDSPLKFSAVSKSDREKFWAKNVEKSSVPKCSTLQNEERMKEDVINSCLSQDEIQNTVLSQIGDIDITRALLRNAMTPKKWLCSDVINAYMVLLKQREELEELATIHQCHFFDTYFYSKVR